MAVQRGRSKWRGEAYASVRQRGRQGDHRHDGGKERAYAFSDPENLIAAFQADIARWNHENRHA